MAQKLPALTYVDFGVISERVAIRFRRAGGPIGAGRQQEQRQERRGDRVLEAHLAASVLKSCRNHARSKRTNERTHSRCWAKTRRMTEPH